jgi:hypothetical protein
MEAEEAETSPEVLADILSLVTNVMIPAGVIATWTVREREQAVKWAAAEHLSASDNDDVKRAPQPPFVARAAELAASPALAQLAVEAWTQYREQGEFSSGWEDVYEMAQGAVTGLLVLLGGRQPSAATAWQQKALSALAQHPGGLASADLMALSGQHGPSREALHAWLRDGEASGTLEHYGYATWKLSGPALSRGAGRP